MLATAMKRFVIIEQITEYEAEVVVGDMVINDSVLSSVGISLSLVGARVGDSVAGGL